MDIKAHAKKTCCLLWVNTHSKPTEPKWKTALCLDELKFQTLFGKHGSFEGSPAPPNLEHWKFRAHLKVTKIIIVMTAYLSTLHSSSLSSDVIFS